MEGFFLGMDAKPDSNEDALASRVQVRYFVVPVRACHLV